MIMKDIKNQAMVSESHYPAALVSVVSLKCMLRVAVNLPIMISQSRKPDLVKVWLARLTYSCRAA